MKKKLIDETLVYDTLGIYITFQWDKWKDIIHDYKKIGSFDTDYMDDLVPFGWDEPYKEDKGRKIGSPA